jgi:hypothetical protein
MAKWKKSQARKNYEKGSKNQRNSRDYMINHPLEYGLLDEGRIEIVRAGLGSLDFFSVKYGTTTVLNTDKKAKIDPDGDPAKVALMKMGFKIKDLMAGFDLISIPHPIPGCVQNIFLIQVKTNRLPDEPYIEALKSILVPSYVSKELHIWYDGNNKEPKIIKL